MADHTVEKFEEELKNDSKNVRSSVFYDTPLFHHALWRFGKVVEPLWRFILTIRWAIARPMNLRVLPSFIPGCSTVPYLKRIPNLTIGEILFLAPMGLLLYLSYHEALEEGDVEKSGVLATYPLYITYLTANKSNSLFSFAFGIPYDRMVRWHTLWAMVTAVMAIFHLVAAYKVKEEHEEEVPMDDNAFGVRRLSGDSHDSHDSIYGLYGATPNFGKFLFDGDVNTSGSLMVISILALVLPSLIPIIRRVMFEAFYYSHVLFALALTIFTMLHGVTEIVIFLAWWIVDLGARYLLMAGYLYPRQASIRTLPANVIEISFPKPDNFTYKSGQYIQLAIPKISFSQFHPFTISSSPHQDHVTVHIRVLGNWTQKLAKLAQEVDSVNILIEGPYGSLSVDLDDVDKYKMVLLVSGGIGVTPMQSIFNTLTHEEENGRELKKVHFVWAVREMEIVKTMNQVAVTERLGGKSFQPNLVAEEQVFNNNGDLEVQANFDDYPTKSTKRSEITKVDYYLTDGDYAPDDDDSESLSIKSNVTLGRPDIMEIVEQMKKAALEMGESHVAVCVCGPSRMIDACREACRKATDQCSSNGVRFDLHEEIFEF